MEYGLGYYIASVYSRILPKTEEGEWEYRALVPRVLAPAILRILLTHNQSY